MAHAGKHRAWKRALPGLVIGALLAGFLSVSAASPRPLSVPGLNPEVLTGAPQTADLQAVEGRIVPRRWVELSLPKGGLVEDVLVTEGQTVKPGDVLITLRGRETLEAQLAAARLQEVLARQAVDELYNRAAVELARAELELVRVQKEYDFRRDHLEGLERPHPQLIIDQAHANLLLAQERLDRSRQDFEKARQKFSNKKSLLWHFINERYVRLALNGLGARVAANERRLMDAQEKYDDLIQPVDPVLLALARAEASVAAATLKQAQADRDDLLNGPDPDALEIARANLSAREAQIAAAMLALEKTQLRSPQKGTVAALNTMPGEWVAAGSSVVIVADLNEWSIETSDLPEEVVGQVQPGQAVRIRIDAYPEIRLTGQVETVSQYYREDDGDIFYTVKVVMDELPEGLRWGMRTRLEFSGNGQ